MTIHVRAPGRVNLIGDHTDYTGGMVLPMAIDRWTEIRGVGAEAISLRSEDEPLPAELDLTLEDPRTAEPHWAKYVAGVVAEMRPARGIAGTVTTDIPIGGGLSSSAALELAVALALGFDGDVLELAQLCRRAEFRASGVPSGIMDQLVIAAGVAGHALLIDCGDLSIEPVAIPDGVEVVVKFVAHRTLVGSSYADRVAECAAAESIIGPLRIATLDDAASIPDAVVRARAQHVIGENLRVRQFGDALTARDLETAGDLMIASHRSLRDLYETSTPAMDGAMEALAARPGVYGARMTGGGFGGCVVALTEAGALADGDGWRVRAVDGAHHVRGDDER
ncbi:MAG TPA: galactokinase family protein [Ilumatobacteraceae bacterium]|nr:galactokinase family protein [Ilumatobacteraceae bacterium]